jgi:HTH-type transcriptional regulator/antitoxin HigA
MELKPIHTKKDYQAALKAVDAPWNAKDGTDAADRLEILSILIERYERDICYWKYRANARCS